MERKTLSALVALLLISAITDGSLFDLGKMIKEVTGKNPFPDFFMYGCYCGLGGKGRPKDEIDWCCFYHDCGYHEIIEKGCKPRTQGYSYIYLSGNVSCGGGTQCQRQICESDRDFVLCLKEHLKNYKKSYRFYFNFCCRGEAPKC